MIKMKRITLFLLLMLVVTLAMAQRNVTGTVMESDTQEPMAQTSIRLLKMDSTFVAGALTNLEGHFHLKAPAAGKYIVQITSVALPGAFIHHPGQDLIFFRPRPLPPWWWPRQLCPGYSRLPERCRSG